MKPMTKANLDTNDPRSNRSLLILALRNLPEGFEWDYSNPCQCAMGLGKYLGLTEHEHASDLADAIGADHDDVHAICYYATRTDQKQSDVTAEQIAQRFERLP